MQNDIKRVIAYSTCSQLGYMFVAEGVGGYSLGIFHLFTHAFFKALLFLGAGSVIHAMHHEQDMRNMGGLRKDIPFTFCDDDHRHAGADRLRHSLHAIGFAGFFSKDAIIEAAFAAGTAFHAAMLRLRLRRSSRRADLLLFLAAGVHDLLRQARAEALTAWP